MHKVVIDEEGVIQVDAGGLVHLLIVYLGCVLSSPEQKGVAINGGLDKFWNVNKRGRGSNNRGGWKIAYL